MVFDHAWAVSCVIVFLAATLQSVTGFGFALIAVPLLLLVYDAHTTVAVTMLISFTTLLMLTVQVRRAIVRPLVINLFLGSLAGIPAGVYGFLHFDVATLKVLISGVTILFSLALATRLRPRGVSGRRMEWGIGGIAGFLSGSISMPGPPVILFLNYRNLPKERFRATTAAYFAAVYPVSLILLAFFGAIPFMTLHLALTLLPFAVLGSTLGIRLFPFVPQAHFQRAVPLLVLAAAAYTLTATLTRTEVAAWLPF